MGQVSSVFKQNFYYIFHETFNQTKRTLSSSTLIRKHGNELLLFAGGGGVIESKVSHFKYGYSLSRGSQNTFLELCAFQKAIKEKKKRFCRISKIRMVDPLSIHNKNGSRTQIYTEINVQAITQNF